jgi:energy-coupling factor transporter ATP-binding protein EcfA2
MLLADLKHPDLRQLKVLLEHCLSLCASGVKKPILEWAEANVVFPHSDRCPTFDRTFAPWFNYPLQAMTSGEYRVISFVGPTGAGKTTFLEILASYVICQDPGHTLIVGQSDEDIGDWAETRLMKMLDAIPATKALMPGNRYARRKTEIIFPHMPLRLGGANINTLQSKSCRYVWLDEVWTYKQGMVEEARARLHDRSNGVLLCMGQGGVKGDEHDKVSETCLQMDYAWECPNCAGFNPYSAEEHMLRYDDARDTKGNWNYPKLIASVRLRCPQCFAEFPDTEFNRKRLSASGKYIPLPESPSAFPDRLGLHLSATAIYWIRWSDIVLQLVRAKERALLGDKSDLRKFTQKREARFWREEDEQVVVQLQSGGYRTEDFEHGELIEGETVRFLTVDRQKNHFWIAIRAWRADGSSRLLRADRIGDWPEIIKLQKAYHVLHPGVAIDSGYDSTEVKAFCAANGFLCLRGDRINSWQHKDAKGNLSKRPYSPFQANYTVDNKICYLVFFSNLHVKDTLNLLRMGRLVPFETMDNVLPEYPLHMSSEIRRDVVSTGGEMSQRWIKIEGRDNHMWDAEVMQVCMAIQFGVIRLDENFSVELELPARAA